MKRCGLNFLRRGTSHRAPTGVIMEQFGKPTSNTIPTIICGFKSMLPKRINQLRQSPGQPVWQRNDYERIIRDLNRIDRVRQYIQNNPLKWQIDNEYRW